MSSLLSPGPHCPELSRGKIQVFDQEIDQTLAVVVLGVVQLS
jgi:hypothetical protein